MYAFYFIENSTKSKTALENVKNPRKFQNILWILKNYQCFPLFFTHFFTFCLFCRLFLNESLCLFCRHFFSNSFQNLAWDNRRYLGVRLYAHFRSWNLSENKINSVLMIKRIFIKNYIVYCVKCVYNYLYIVYFIYAYKIILVNI